ncbi:GPP34 family phosphoprotein [Pontiellaceae bacterium B12227]|nr:GPP34 family phosphoprotein [Pontiellaceae bacterium B12227]
MTADKPLLLYEEIMLLALRDEKGTMSAQYPEQMVAGAILAELLLDRRISVADNRKQLVDVQNHTLTGDPIIDQSLKLIASAKRRASLKTWVTRLAGMKGLRHSVARQLCHRGILRADEDTVLFIFKRRIYPELNPVPEKEIINRLHTAIFTDSNQLDPRTIVLVSLAGGSELLNQTFGRREIKSRKKRIEHIVNGELTGKATKEVIAACQAAIMVAVIMPAMMVSTIQS